MQQRWPSCLWYWTRAMCMPRAHLQEWCQQFTERGKVCPLFSLHQFCKLIFYCRYCNMDYIVLSALAGLCLLRVIISYDIACQWSKNLATRMPEYPEYMQINLDHVEVRMVVPSFHICAHGADCQQLFSFAFILWVARMVGEEVETGWAHMNLASPSIQEMGPGHCHEVLNDHWGGWNFKKIITFRMWHFHLCSCHSLTTKLHRNSLCQTV